MAVWTILSLSFYSIIVVAWSRENKGRKWGNKWESWMIKETILRTPYFTEIGLFWTNNNGIEYEIDIIGEAMTI